MRHFPVSLFDFVRVCYTTRPKPAMPRRLRRMADLTGIRLGGPLLGYLIAMAAIITLCPFRFALTPQHGFIYEWKHRLCL